MSLRLAHSCPGRVRRHVRGWPKPTLHSRRIRWSTDWIRRIGTSRGARGEAFAAGRLTCSPSSLALRPVIYSLRKASRDRGHSESHYKFDAGQFQAPLMACQLVALKSGTALHLPRLKDLDGFDTRFLTAGFLRSAIARTSCKFHPLVAMSSVGSCYSGPNICLSKPLVRLPGRAER